jgi:hypothetical protein
MRRRRMSHHHERHKPPPKHVPFHCSFCCPEKEKSHDKRLHFTLGPVAVKGGVNLGSKGHASRRHSHGDLSMIINNTQKVTITITPKGPSGRPAKIDGVPTWQNTDESLGILVVAADGLSAVYTTVDGAAGNSQVIVDADADLGSGVVDITGLLDINVVQPEEQATTIEIIAGTPEPK